MAMTEKMANWLEPTAALHAAQSILLVTHVMPDGDAVGSMLGLFNALSSVGKTVDCAVDGGIPDSFEFLPGADVVQGRLEAGAWDLMISLDASDEERTGEVGAYGRRNSQMIINLDHHATNTFFGDIHLVDPRAVAASEIVFHWLCSMEFVFSVDVAVPLLTGLVTDTLGFRTSNVTSETLVIAQELMNAGASLAEITERVLDTRSFSGILLWREAFRSVELTESGVISLEVTQEVLQQLGLSGTSENGLSGFLIRVQEAKVSATFTEIEDGNIILSMRAKPGFDVSGVAFSLGGGGHKQAAGATIPGPMAEARRRTLAMLEDVVNAGKFNIA